jgi:hypothetical protein
VCLYTLIGEICKWNHTIDMELTEMGWKNEEWINFSEDRGKLARAWRYKWTLRFHKLRRISWTVCKHLKVLKNDAAAGNQLAILNCLLFHMEKYRVIKNSLCTWWLQYKNTQKYFKQFQMAITEYIRNVDRAILNTVFANTVRRVNKCLETGRGHFEHYW